MFGAKKSTSPPPPPPPAKMKFDVRPSLVVVNNNDISGSVLIETSHNDNTVSVSDGVMYGELWAWKGVPERLGPGLAHPPLMPAARAWRLRRSPALPRLPHNLILLHLRHSC
jgi:hypothetical protein